MANGNTSPGGGMTIRLNGNGVKLGTAVRIITIFVSVILAFGYLTFSVKSIEAQVKANASQNITDQRTATIVEHQQQQIDTMSATTRDIAGILQEIKQDLREVATKLEERTSSH